MLTIDKMIDSEFTPFERRLGSSPRKALRSPSFPLDSDEQMNMMAKFSVFSMFGVCVLQSDRVN
jgi:hypothetical protein